MFNKKMILCLSLVYVMQITAYDEPARPYQQQIQQSMQQQEQRPLNLRWLMRGRSVNVVQFVSQNVVVNNLRIAQNQQSSQAQSSAVENNQSQL